MAFCIVGLERSFSSPIVFQSLLKNAVTHVTASLDHKEKGPARRDVFVYVKVTANTEGRVREAALALGAVDVQVVPDAEGHDAELLHTANSRSRCPLDMKTPSVSL